jgi:hypothetical protein
MGVYYRPKVQHLYKTVLNKVRDRNNITRLPYRCDAPDCRRYMEMDLTKSDQNIIQTLNRIIKLEFRNPVPILSDLQGWVIGNHSYLKLLLKIINTILRSIQIGKRDTDY